MTGPSSERTADAENVRVALQSAMCGRWGREDALRALMRLESEHDCLLAVAQRVADYGEALIARNYDPGSAAIRELVAAARAALAGEKA